MLFLTPNIFFWIATSGAEAAAINPKGTKTLLANGLSTTPIKSKTVPTNGPKGLLRNHPTYFTWDNWVSKNFILADKPELLQPLFYSWFQLVELRIRQCYI